MQWIDFVRNVEQWAADRNLIKGSTVHKQALKGLSEVGELCDNLAKGKDIRDDIGDCCVVGIIINKIAGKDVPLALVQFDVSKNAEFVWSYLDDVITDFSCCMFMKNAAPKFNSFDELQFIAQVHGYNFEECLDKAWNDIKDRKGVMFEGVFIKESDPRYEEIMRKL